MPPREPHGWTASERPHEALTDAWTPWAWRSLPALQQPAYRDADRVARALAEVALRTPRVTPAEVLRLREDVAAASRGEAFVLQGGDCVERFADCEPGRITARLTLLDRMAEVLAASGCGRVVPVARLAGQYAKPRSQEVESVAGETLPVWRGDLVHGAEPTARAREPDPDRLLEAARLADRTVAWIRGLGGRLAQVATSHEGLLLPWEEAHTREEDAGWFNLGAHTLWLGDRTRQLDGAHVAYFRGLENPIGVKLGPSATPAEVVALLRTVDPADRPGRVTLITRLGADAVASRLPAILDAVRASGRRHVLWACDPMHGNTVLTASGLKTRHFDRILAELRATLSAHVAAGSRLGGVHVELAADDVTECTGGPQGLREEDLARGYETGCDPRLNAAQSLALAEGLAGLLRAAS
jgi:3-deoxy-7-phosphoheptulonate synthase